MPIHFRENQYQGINAHFQSFLQNEPGGWESSHTDYITLLRVALDEQLPSGYIARSEMGLQISEITPANRPPGRSKPDLTIFQTRDMSHKQSPSGPLAVPTALFPIAETVDLEEPLPGLVIYQTGEGTNQRPVTRIEVLSPANKPGGSHYHSYFQKRSETLRAGLRLIEIDYLHQSRPVIRSIRSYPDRDENAFPYSIVVSDPRPSFEQGQSAFYGFRVNQHIEPIEIPLASEDSIGFDFGRVYDQFFESSRFCGEIVDYEQLPLRFETYAPLPISSVSANVCASLPKSIRHRQIKKNRQQPSKATAEN